MGAGFAGGAHVEALRRVPGVDVAAVAGSTEARARAAADRLGVARSTADYRALLADPSIDAIHNCTPNDLHHQITAAALAAGKHVLAEKPLAMDSRETADLVGRAARAGTVSGVCFNYRHYPLVAEARAMLADGRAAAAPDQRRLSPGLAARGDRLELAAPVRAIRRLPALGDIGSAPGST